jgi:gamma-tubulin complex component 2
VTSADVEVSYQVLLLVRSCANHCCLTLLQSRTFPGHGAANIKPNPAPPLNTLSYDEQQLILLRELLLVLSGVEGQYIRIKASPAPSALTTAAISSIPTLSIAEASRQLQQISFVIDMDSANRSIASQVSHLFPICESAVHIREFIKLHARYDYGFVSHAAIAAMKAIIREFDIVIAQLENLLVNK